MRPEGRLGPPLARARGVGIILVVLYHADVALHSTFPSYVPFYAVVENVQYLAVPTFLISAGLAMANKRTSTSALFAAASNYFYVFGLWTVISIALSALVVQTNVGVPLSFKALAKTFILPASPLWFPYGLGLLLLGAALIRRINPNIALAMAFMVGFIPLLPGFDRTAIVAICSNAFVFFTSFLFRDRLLAPLRKAPRRTFLVTLTAYLIILVYCRRLGILGLPVTYDALSLLGFFAIVSFWQLQPFGLVSKAAAFLGRSALPILVMHDFWLHVGLRGLIHVGLGPMNARAEMMLPPSLTVFALVCTTFSYGFLGKSSSFFVAPTGIRSSAAGFGRLLSLARSRFRPVGAARRPGFSGDTADRLNKDAHAAPKTSP